MNRQLLRVGITHESAPLSIRESLRPDAVKQRTMLDRLGGLASGRLVLATCERFDVFATTNRTDVSMWARLLARWFHLPAALVGRHLQPLHGRDAAEHLLRIAAGLESRIQGELQILGQVRESILLAGGVGALDSDLHALGRAALRAGKRVRHETTLNAEARSIATIAVECIERHVSPLSEKSVLVVGTGSLGPVLASELCRRRTGRLSIAGRNEERTASLAARYGAKRFGVGELGQAVADCDAAVFCTSASSYILDAPIIGRDRVRPLLLLDLSVPRNIDPCVRQLAPVRLWDMDSLVSGVSIGLDGVAAAEGIVAEELGGFLQWRRERSATSAIREAVRLSGTRDPRALHEQIARIKAEAAA